MNVSPHSLTVGYFQKTASAGNPLGLFEIAKSYEQGSGIAADPVKAYAYANLAAARGLTEAATLRDRIAATLVAADIAEAQAMARDWKPVPIENASK